MVIGSILGKLYLFKEKIHVMSYRKKIRTRKRCQKYVRTFWKESMKEANNFNSKTIKIDLFCFNEK